MPNWRCPHCGTPQAETARCWVCHQSTTSCGTCRHFRRAVVAHVGYCGSDRSHSPLTGREIRSCWERGSERVAQPDEEGPERRSASAHEPSAGDAGAQWGLWAAGGQASVFDRAK